MKPLFKPYYINRIIGILLILLLLKLLWFVLQTVWLSEAGVDHQERSASKPFYYRIKVAEDTAVIAKPKPKNAATIRDIKLLAVYRDAKSVVVTVQYKGKTKVLGKGEAINGYVLEDAGNDYALFSKDGKDYRLTLYDPKKSSSLSSITPVVEQVSSPDAEKKSGDGEIIEAGGRRIIEKDLLTHYTTHIDEVYKNIGIQDYRKDNRLEGFKVTFVKRGSPFAKLGLKRGDILKAVNGQVLTSYGAAFDIYKQMDDISNITLTIQRGNKEMELEYEID